MLGIVVLTDKPAEAQEHEQECALVQIVRFDNEVRFFFNKGCRFVSGKDGLYVWVSVEGGGGFWAGVLPERVSPRRNSP